MTRQLDGKTWNVFLSSTVRDLASLRDHVQVGLLKYAEAACFLSENWVGGFDDTVARCRARVERADGFILLLGFWYGSIPTGADKSITHIEFDCAVERWRQDFPPIAVMAPREASPAYRQLTALADKILGEETKNGLDRSDHEKRCVAFHTSVKHSWRTVNVFGDKHELAMQALTCVMRWQGRTPAAAAAGLVAPIENDADADPIEPACLGRLGRTRQLDDASDVLAQLALERHWPGVALVAHGGADAGPGEFLAALVNAEPALRRCRVKSLPVQQTSLAALVSWVARTLGLPHAAPVLTPQALAELLFVALKREPLAFVLNRIGFLQGGIRAFADQFWAPLYTALVTLAGGQPFQHQLIVVISDWSTDATTIDECTVAAGDQLPDGETLVRLSPLDAITKRHMTTWLKELDIDEARRRDIVAAALTDDEGHEDGTPSRVFARLRAHDWDE
jgi:hypothetical protein